MPIGPSNGYAWRGRRACQCVIDATAAYEKLARSSLNGYIYQACYSFASASAGTHAKGGALDTVQLTDRGIRIASSIGFWPSNRYRWQGFGMNHCHWVLFGCPHASAALSAQERDLRAGRDGLALHKADRHRSLRPARPVTFAQWQASQSVSAWMATLKTVTVRGLNLARAGHYRSRFVLYAQSWLRATGWYKSPIDGRWGQVTQAAYDGFRRHIGLTGKDATGPVGWYSLKALHDEAKSKKPIAK